MYRNHRGLYSNHHAGNHGPSRMDLQRLRRNHAGELVAADFTFGDGLHVNGYFDHR